MIIVWILVACFALVLSSMLQIVGTEVASVGVFMKEYSKKHDP